MTSWIRDAYRGYLWPFLTFISAISYGMASETHSGWHYAEWPSLAVAAVAVNVTRAKVAKQ